MEFDEISIDRVCRTCLTTTPDDLEMPLLTGEDGEKVNFIDILNFTFGKMIQLNDALPYKICSQCQEKVKNSYDFKCRVTETNSILRASEFATQNDKTIQTGADSGDETRVDDVIEESINFEGEMSNLNDEIFDEADEDESQYIEEDLKLTTTDIEKVEEVNEATTMRVFIPSEDANESALYESNNLEETNESQEEITEKKSTVASKSKQFACTKCDKSFNKASHLKRHKLTHEEAKFICDVDGCDKRYVRQDHLSVHRMNSHAEPRPYTCDEPNCKKGFHRQDYLKRHIETHHGNHIKHESSCEVCGRTFKSKKYLKSHLKSHENPKPLTCKFCNDVFANKNILNEHMAKAHQDEKPYLCSECGLKFVRNDYLVIHMRRHLGIKPYKCRFCDKAFPRATDLNVHERYHTNEKTHLCNLCGKGFQRAYNLLVHMRVHTGDKPYKCSFCAKCFSQGNDLKAHIRRHTGERFKCELCNEGFIQGYHLTQHKRTVHGLNVASHIRRVEKFATTSSAADLLDDPNIEYVTDEQDIEIKQDDEYEQFEILDG